MIGADGRFQLRHRLSFLALDRAVIKARRLCPTHGRFDFASFFKPSQTIQIVILIQRFLISAAEMFSSKMIFSCALVASCAATIFNEDSLETTPADQSAAATTSTALVIRAKRQCGGMGGCGCGGSCGGGCIGAGCGGGCSGASCGGGCSGASCGCGSLGMCGSTCCPSAPPPCTCGTPGCAQCVTNTVYVPVQQTTCCRCCQPVCTQACVNGGGCSCGCTRGGCGRKRRSLLAIANEEMSKNGDSMI
ncbi:unnamed protein product [Caenorhabditis auriculariae]|uniref:Uncharacterized protein n=1 Tax=Caenorhabditis auriculariae TaxID=2777116 RepID=A0A8S1HVP1_9PELO|nr:unnamed protein product [Caenorhabditis auriculariae]